MQSSISIVVGTGMILGQDIPKTIEQQLHVGSPYLASMEYNAILARTPVLTTALMSDEKAESYTDTSTEDLAYLYVEDANQLTEWGRVYAQYQEGGQLGLPTYTNPPRRMYAKVTTVDIPQIEDWAAVWAEDALDLCVAGKGVPV